MSDFKDEFDQVSNENSLGEEVIDRGIDKGKDKVKEGAGDLAKKGGKKIIGGVKSAANSISKKGLGGAVKGGTKAAIGLGKGAIAFILSGPLGWAVGFAGFVLISGLLAGSPDDVIVGDQIETEIVGSESSDIGDTGLGVDGNMSFEEEAATLIGDNCPPADYSDMSGDSSIAGELNDPNSTYYKNAKQTFDIWVEGGLSGAAAAGIVGWTIGEGGYHVVGRAEGYYGSNDPKKVSIRYGNVPRNYAFPDKPGGGGIYQFTPYTKYAPLGDESWEDLVAMHEHMFNIMADTGPSWEESPDWIAIYDYTGGNHSFREFAEHSDPKMTVLMWNAHERMSDQVFQSRNLKAEKESKAQMVYDLFEAHKYDFDPVAFEQNFGSGAGGGLSGDGVGINDPCIVLGGSPWGGEGGQPSIRSGIWRYNNVPDEIKQYALDLESIPLRYGEAGDWKWNTSADHMQCVDLSSNLMKLIWEKNGEPIGDTKNLGNGGDIVGGYVGRFGGSSSTTPTAGAVFSTQSGQTMCGARKCGHTGVVSHVFDNGDMLVIEQNWGPFSGTMVGKNTYNYRYVPKVEQDRDSFTFYDPSANGYTLSNGLKSL